MTPATDERDQVSPGEPRKITAIEARVGLVVGGTYRIKRHIGSGGSSHVFEAEHTRLGRLFAVKLLRPDLCRSEKAAQRFRREARAVARLQSEHVVSVIDCGELDDQTPYLVMELLEGEDLRFLLNRVSRLPARRAVQIVIEACRGLSAVHAAGLVHRDLKPENLFIARRSTGQDWCKVLDFGVAKMEASFSTAQGAILGTARYMAPEQLVNSAAVGSHTDVYALCAILYECLAGRPLHHGETVQEVMYSVMNREPAVQADLDPMLPPALVEAVTRGLAKDPSVRPKNTQELATLIENALADTPDTRAGTLADYEPPPAAPRLRRAGDRMRSRKSQIVAVVVAAGALGWTASRTSARAPDPRHATAVDAVREPTPRGLPLGTPAVSAMPQPSATQPTLPSLASAASPLTLESGYPPHGSTARRPARPTTRPKAAALRTIAVSLDESNPYSEP
jgi:eukaryotic-like serine/threonine-protein kinase